MNNGIHGGPPIYQQQPAQPQAVQPQAPVQHQAQAAAHAPHAPFQAQQVPAPAGHARLTTSGRQNTMRALLKKAMPKEMPAARYEQLGLPAFSSLAHANVASLVEQQPKEAQADILKDLKKHLRHLAQGREPEAERAAVVGSLAQALSTRLKEGIIGEDCRGEALRILTRLMAPGQLDKSRFNTFPNIADSHSPLMTQDARSAVVTHLQEGWHTFSERKKGHVAMLMLDQFKHGGISDSIREPTLQFFASTILPHSYQSTTRRYMTGIKIRPLDVLKTINASLTTPRTEDELHSLSAKLDAGLREMEDTHATVGRREINRLATHVYNEAIGLGRDMQTSLHVAVDANAMSAAIQLQAQQNALPAYEP